MSEDEDLDDREREVRVDGDRQDVDRDEQPDEQASEAMDVLEREPRPFLGRRALPAMVRPRQTTTVRTAYAVIPAARAAYQLDRARRQVHSAARPRAAVQASFATTRLSARKRPGTFSASSQAGPSKPTRNAALA